MSWMHSSINASFLRIIENEALTPVHAKPKKNQSASQRFPHRPDSLDENGNVLNNYPFSKFKRATPRYHYSPLGPARYIRRFLYEKSHNSRLTRTKGSMASAV